LNKKRVGKIIEEFNEESAQRSVELLAIQPQPKKISSRGTRGTTRGSGSSDSVDIKSLWEQDKVYNKLSFIKIKNL